MNQAPVKQAPVKNVSLTRADIILLVLVVTALPFVYQNLWQTNEHASHAHILLDNKSSQKLALYENRFVHIEGVLGESKLEINNGRIRFAASPCKAKHCIHQGWLGNASKVIACLPNRVAVQLASNNTAYDSINF